MTATQPGEIPCPSCSRPLPLPVAAVLSGQPIVCAGCGLELTAQRETSREALDALGRWYEETGAARDMAASAAGTGGEGAAKKQRSR
ncbi:hypothetical protein [Pelagibius sp.]|uniref:hypothetical protein n=1 Tax=Pelagibius sp. TaxID=1931238 RepID=UPI00262CE33B|nr:hypothetical protein [Pelagibius sp.]